VLELTDSQCGEGVPERTKGYFTSHLAAVSKILHVRHPKLYGKPLLSEANSELGLSCPNYCSI
jgi:hypothetical protein